MSTTDLDRGYRGVRVDNEIDDSVYTVTGDGQDPAPHIFQVAPDHGNEGDHVSLDGVDLDTLTRVSFGGVAAQFMCRNYDAAVVLVPAGTGIVDVEVENIFGSFTLVGGFAYGPNSPPKLLASFSWFPTRPVVDQQVSFTSTSTVGVGGDIVDLRWDVAGTAGAGPSVAATFDTPGQKPVTLTVTDQSGATSTATQLVTVSAVTQPPGTPGDPPTADWTYSPADPQQVGIATNFDGRPSRAGGAAIVNYSWALDSVARSGAQMSYTFRTAGDHVVTLTVLDSDGHSDSSSKTLNTVQVPLVAEYSYLPDVPGDDGVIQLDASMSHPTQLISDYEWEVDGSVNPAHGVKTSTQLPEGDHEVTLRVKGPVSPDDEQTKTIVVTGHPYADLILSEAGLLAYWRANDVLKAAAAGSARDWTGQAPAGYVVGDPPITAGPGLTSDPDSGSSVYAASGAGQPGISATSTTAINAARAWTFECWLRPDAVGGGFRTLVHWAQGGAWFVGIRANGTVAVTNSENDLDANVLVASTVALTPGTIYHVAAGVDEPGGVGRVQVNATNGGPFTARTAAAKTTSTSVGRQLSTTLSPVRFAGQISDIAIYGRLLSTAECANHYLAGD